MAQEEQVDEPPCSPGSPTPQVAQEGLPRRGCRGGVLCVTFGAPSCLPLSPMFYTHIYFSLPFHLRKRLTFSDVSPVQPAPSPLVFYMNCPEGMYGAIRCFQPKYIGSVEFSGPEAFPLMHFDQRGWEFQQILKPTVYEAFKNLTSDLTTNDQIIQQPLTAINNYQYKCRHMNPYGCKCLAGQYKSLYLATPKLFIFIQRDKSIKTNIWITENDDSI